ncbi:hypothetical protein MMC14_009033 [Varicellaria rhodocarpa]|nr:hypothetical protein [Varicellaria rhodocarpa]
MANDSPTPQQHPALNIPSSTSTVEVQIINTTTDIVCSAEYFFKPVVRGHEVVNMHTFSFLIHHKTLGKTILFDLGSRKDWWNLAPVQYDSIQKKIPGLRVTKDVPEVLEEGGTDLKRIDAVIWSHWHWDHTGDISKFPDEVELIVGPGVQEAFLPGYPTTKDSPLLESDFKNRTVREIAFDSQKRIGQYPYHDLFGDGSVYILDVPGHAIGHISALVRTTSDTFVFLGGDVCHYGGAFRPTPYSPLPDDIPSSTPLTSKHLSHPCPCSIFTSSHPNPKASRTTPWYRISDIEGSYYTDPPTAQTSVDALMEFDADENVLVCIAHDGGLLEVLDWYPNGTINQWKEKGWKERTK